MKAVTMQEIVDGLRNADKEGRQELADFVSDLITIIEAHGIAPSDNVKQADEETHRRVDEAVRNGRIEDRRAGGEAVNKYDYEIKCDFCNILLGFWRYAGPFHGSMCCAECKNNEDGAEAKP